MSDFNQSSFRPITKNINVDQWLQLASLAAKHSNLSDFNEAAVSALPQATRKTRLEWVSRFRSTFLSINNDRIERTPALVIWGSQKADTKLKRELLYIYYLRSFPLVWHAVRQLILPRIQKAIGAEDKREIPIENWDAFLAKSLVPCAGSSFVRTRNHLTSIFQKFGLLDTEAIQGERLGKRFIVNPVQPTLEALLFGFGLEYMDHGWTSRTYIFLSKKSWSRIAFAVSENYVRWALDQAERVGLGYGDYFGSEEQFTWQAVDIPSAIAEFVTNRHSANQLDRQILP